MYLTRFDAHGFRNLLNLSLEPHRNLTVLHGANGAGKSAVLEAIQCLASGHSFRTRQARDYTADGAESLSLAGRLQDPVTGQEHRCGLNRSSEGELSLRLNFRAADSVAEVARLMPVKALVPDSHRLIQEGPEERRRFIDWGCFHQTEAFAPAWRQFRRALSQRNEVLRQRGSDDEVRSWDAAVARHGTELDALRREYVVSLSAFVQERIRRANAMFHVEHRDRAADPNGSPSMFHVEHGRIPASSLTSGVFHVEHEKAPRSPSSSLGKDEQATQPPIQLDLELRSGWPEALPLEQALVERLEQHRRMRTTTDGPHRADLVIKANGRLARPRLSRGQQKVLVYLLHLAQLDCLYSASGRRAIVLCDDLASELDPVNLARVLDQLKGTRCQRFITAAEPVPAALQGALDEEGGLKVAIVGGRLKT